MYIGVVFDLDVLSGSEIATTDSGGTIATFGIYLGIAGDGDVGAITGSIAIGTAAANTSTGLP